MRFLVPILCLLLTANVEATGAPNNWPVVGVLIQEYRANISYIPASYVKFVEGAGARVVPIHINRNESYYREILSQVNGVLFPGGDVDVHNSGYGRAGKVIFDYAVRANQVQDYFPLWGTCNGFEMIAYLSIDHNVLTKCNAMNEPRPLRMSANARSSRLFGKLGHGLRSLLTKENTTANYHENCLTLTNFTRYGIDRHYDVLSTNVDFDGLEYISTMEAKRYPFYAVQFHPEKNMYEWPTAEGHSDIPHTAAGIEVGQFFAQFFINEARKSKHKMSKEVFERESIYNFQANYTGDRSAFMQMYFFEE